jgi:hypothetical protein
MRFSFELSRQHTGTDFITDDPQDYTVFIDGPAVGRIYVRSFKPNAGKWLWRLQSPQNPSGMSDTLVQAKEDLRQRWFTETQRLTRD